MSNSRTILILSSTGGAGHEVLSHLISDAVSDSLTHNLDVTTQIIHPVNSIWQELDHIRKWSGRLFRSDFDGEDLFNCLAKYRIKFFADVFINQGSKYYEKVGPQREKLLRDFLIKQAQENAPVDLILSTIPYNAATHNVAAEFNIPFLLMPADVDPTLYLKSFPEKPHRKMLYLTPLDPSIIAQGLKPDVKASYLNMIETLGERVVVTGPPAIPAHTDTNVSKATLLEEYGIDKQAKVLTIMMGSLGNKRIIDYVRSLEAYSGRLHVFACFGRDTKSLKLAESSLSLPENISVELHGFTDQLASFMQMSDVVANMPSGMTFYSALATETPIILLPGFDYQQEALKKIAALRGWGQSVSKPDEFVGALTKLLQTGGNNAKQQPQYPQSNFAQTLTQAVRQALVGEQEIVEHPFNSLFNQKRYVV